MSEQTHFVTYIGKHTAFVDRFMSELAARSHYESVKRNMRPQFASLHINQKLAEVYANAETAAKIVESSIEEN
jgi:hypothetical protein